MLGRVIVVTAVVATVASLVLVQRFATTYEDGLAVTEDSATLVAESVGPVRVLVDDLATLASSVADGLELTESLVDTTTEIVDDVGVASSTNLADTAEGAAAVADRLAQTLEQIERLIPGDRDGPTVADDLRTLADGLGPVAEQLRTIGGRLQGAVVDLDEVETSLAGAAEQVDVFASDIGELGPGFDALEATATDLQVRAARASDRVGLDLWLIRVLLLAVGGVFVATGIVTQRVAGMWAEDQERPVV